VKGCTHQSSSPPFAYNTICWPARAPLTRPSIASVLSGPPRSAAGTLVNSIEGRRSWGLERQPLKKIQNKRSRTFV
jgi:hypothetical protein